MKGKRNLKHLNTVVKIIYPEQYIGYLILSVFKIAFCIYMAYLISRDTTRAYLNINDMFVHIILYIPWILISSYYVLTIVCLVLKKIKLEISETDIQINKIFTKRKILLTDIESIHINRPYQYPLSYVVIKRKKHGNKYSNRLIIFPVSWFSIKDIRYVLETTTSYNNKIKFVDISKLD
jgi:hypothetical protein